MMEVEIFDLACAAMGVPKGTESHRAISEDLVKTRFVDVEVIIKLEGKNLTDEPMWAYVRIFGAELAKMFRRMRLGLDFRPSKYGIVLIWHKGFGERAWQTHVMRRDHGMVEVPPP